MPKVAHAQVQGSLGGTPGEAQNWLMPILCMRAIGEYPFASLSGVPSFKWGATGEMTMNTMHIYDHEKACLFLDNGKVVRVRDKVKREADELLEPLTEKARQKGLIGEKDVVVTFSA